MHAGSCESGPVGRVPTRVDLGWAPAATFNGAVAASSSPLTDDVVRRALAPALRARLLGSGLVAVGVVLLVVLVLGWLVALPGALVTGLVALSVIGVVALLGLLGPRHWVLRMDHDGYRVRGLRSAQARSSRWADVLDLQATTVQGARCLVLRLRDGRTTTLPVDALEGDREQLTELVTAHLDRGHGYRRLR